MGVVGPLLALRETPGVALLGGACFVFTVQADVESGVEDLVPLGRGEPLPGQSSFGRVGADVPVGRGVAGGFDLRQIRPRLRPVQQLANCHDVPPVVGVGSTVCWVAGQS